MLRNNGVGGTRFVTMRFGVGGWAKWTNLDVTSSAMAPNIFRVAARILGNSSVISHDVSSEILLIFL